MKQEAAKFLLDVAKLLIGGVLLAGIMRLDIPPKLLFFVGGGATSILIVAAFILIWLNNRGKQ
jgi:uncharacterized membrane protein YraQ (UPF0718 family)